MAIVTVFDLDTTSAGLDETRSYTEGGSAIRLAPDAALSATGNFAGQSLTISGLLAEVQIGFANGVTIVGNAIRVGGTTIGTFAGGTGGSEFVVSFNANATASRVQTLIRNVTFRDTSDDPTVNHSLTVDLAGTIRSDVVTVTPANDRPVADLNGAASGNNATATFIEQTPIAVAPAATLSDPDSANFTSLTARLTSRPDGNAVESLSLNTAAADAAGLAGLSVNYNQSNGTLTITGSASQATYQTILQGIVYNNTSEHPNSSNRTMRVTVNDGEDTSVSRDVSISVARANDAPVVDLNGGSSGTSASLAYNVGDPLTKIAPAGTVLDVDSANFSGGSLSIAFTGNGVFTDQLAIITDATVTLTGPGGSTVRINGTAIGSVSGGGNGTDLVITFNGNATPARVQTLLEHIGYSNSSGSPSTLAREITFTLNDGDGTANGGQNIGSATATITFPSAPDVFKLTPGADSPPPTAANLTINGSASTLNASDNLDGGPGTDSLVLYGSGTFDLNALAGYAGIEEVQLVNFTGSTAALYLRDGTTSAVTASGSGRTYIQLQGTATATSILGSDGNNYVYVESSNAASWNPSITINGGNGSDTLHLGHSNSTLDLQPTTLASVEQLYLGGTNLTALIDADTLTDVTHVDGGGKLVTAGSALDLTDKSINVTVESTNAIGTTFTVNSSTTAFQVFGGAGNSDAIQATSFAFTPAELDAIFATSSIETIIDANGPHSAPASAPDVFKLTPGADSPPPTAANLTINGSASTLNASDNLDGGPGTDSLVLYGSGTFDLNALAGYAGIEEVQLVNFTGSTAALYLRDGTTSAVTASGSGRTYIQLQGTATATSILGSDGNNYVYVESSNAASWNPSITINGGNGSDTLHLGHSNSTLDLQPTTLASVEQLYLGGTNLTALIDADTLTDVTHVDGGGKLVTAGSALDLTDKSINVTVESTNAIGTTFTVNSSTTAFQVFGGPGTDSLQTSSFAFTATERDAIFNGSSIEVIRDTSGFYGDETSNTISGTAAADNMEGNGGADRLIGSGGPDLLAGGAGADTFVFNFPSEGVDTVSDFVSGVDKLEISVAGFGGGLTVGTDPATVFGSSSNATFASETERFHLDTSTDTLYFDADGSDTGADPVAMAQFPNHVTLQPSDWLFV